VGRRPPCAPCARPQRDAVDEPLAERGAPLVTLDEAGDLQDLALTTRINGKEVQRGTTAEQVFGAPRAERTRDYLAGTFG